MNWAVLIQLIWQIIAQLRKTELELNAKGETLGVDWERLLKYIPEILELILRIVRDQGGTAPSDPGPGFEFESDAVRDKFFAGMSEELRGRKIDWKKVIGVLLPIIIELIGSMDDKQTAAA